MKFGDIFIELVQTSFICCNVFPRNERIFVCLSVYRHKRDLKLSISSYQLCVWIEGNCREQSPNERQKIEDTVRVVSFGTAATAAAVTELNLFQKSTNLQILCM